MRILLLAAIILAVGFTSCRESQTEAETGNIELVFMPKYNGNPMVFFQDINNTDNSKLYFQKLEFFLSELKAKSGNGMVDLSDVEYISMNDLISAELAKQGVTITLKNVPVGNYEQLAFGVGVTDQINSKSPANFESSSPLGMNANYWASWNSYIFCKIEGNYTPNGGSVGSFLYHGGVNGMYQPRTFNKTFDVESGKTTKIMIHLHGEELFFKQGAQIDLVNDNSTHSGADGSDAYNLAKRAITNLANALHVH